MGKKSNYKTFIKKFRIKENIINYTTFIIFLMLCALNYNLILIPNNIVIGGISGLGNAFKSLIDPSYFIFGVNIILIIFAFILLGKEHFKNAIIGGLLYPILIKVTEPLASQLLPYLTLDNELIYLLMGAIFDGLCFGVIYKRGFSTGGSDILTSILAKYFHISSGKASLIVNGTIIVISGFILGLKGAIFGIIGIYISTTLSDRIMIGISDSKQFIIETNEPIKLKDFIITELNYGVTLLDAHGGYLKDKKEIIMCVVNNRDYIFFENAIKKIDPDAFFVVSDCYEVSGGKRRNRFPFI